MYLAGFRIGDASYIQAAASLVYPRSRGDRSSDDRAERWWERFRALMRGIEAVGDAATSLRVELGAELTATLFVVTSASREGALRRALGSLTQLDVLADGEVRFPADRAAHDALLNFPRCRCGVALRSMRSGEAWFAFDFRVHGYLHDLLIEAHALGFRLAYHLNVEPMSIDAELQRRAARNALHISGIRGVPASLEQLQQELAHNLRRATHVCEEIVGVDDAAAANWLREALDQRFRATYGRYVVPEFSICEDDHAGSLVATRHRGVFDELGDDELCAAAITSADRIALLSWEPTSQLIGLMPRVDLAVEEPEPSTVPDDSGMPRPYTGDQPYLFISYKREDLARIAPLVAGLAERGHRIWYDRGIPGGADWDAMIEERLRGCAMLVMFVSHAAVLSRFVLREVKFATNALDKPVVPFALDSGVEPSEGMAMLLNQYQVIHGTAASSPIDELDVAIRYARVRLDRRRGAHELQ